PDDAADARTAGAALATGAATATATDAVAAPGAGDTAGAGADTAAGAPGLRRTAMAAFAGICPARGGKRSGDGKGGSAHRHTPLRTKRMHPTIRNKGFIGRSGTHNSDNGEW